MPCMIRRLLCSNVLTQEVIDVLEVPWFCYRIVMGSVGKLSPYLGGFANLVQASHVEGSDIMH